MTTLGGWPQAPRVQSDAPLKASPLPMPRLVKRSYQPFLLSGADAVTDELVKAARTLTADNAERARWNKLAHRPFGEKLTDASLGKARKARTPKGPLEGREGKKIARPSNFKQAPPKVEKLLGQLTKALDRAEQQEQVAAQRATAAAVLTHAMEHVGGCWQTVRVLAGALARVHERENELSA